MTSVACHRQMGARVELIPSVNRKVTPDIIKLALVRVRELAASPDTHWTNQFDNSDNRAAYHAMAREISDFHRLPS